MKRVRKYSLCTDLASDVEPVGVCQTSPYDQSDPLVSSFSPSHDTVKLGVVSERFLFG